MSKARKASLLLLLPLLILPSVQASSSSVTRGRFHNLAAGTIEALDIWGHAQLVRADDKTILTVHIVGLKPSHQYQAEVHKKPDCGGGDYRLNGEEIEADFATNPDGNGHAKTTVEGTADQGARSVVIEDAGDEHLACASLE